MDWAEYMDAPKPEPTTKPQFQFTEVKKPAPLSKEEERVNVLISVTYRRNSLRRTTLIILKFCRKQRCQVA